MTAPGSINFTEAIQSRFAAGHMPLAHMLASDERDWEAIRAWSERIADVVKEKVRL